MAVGMRSPHGGVPTAAGVIEFPTDLCRRILVSDSCELDFCNIYFFNQISRFSIKQSMLNLRLVSKLNYFIYNDINLKFQHFVSI